MADQTSRHTFDYAEAYARGAGGVEPTVAGSDAE
jgi:hypothetical protein